MSDDLLPFHRGIVQSNIPTSTPFYDIGLTGEVRTKTATAAVWCVWFNKYTTVLTSFNVLLTINQYNPKGQVLGIADSGLDYNQCLFRDDNVPVTFSNGRFESSTHRKVLELFWVEFGGTYYY